MKVVSAILPSRSPEIFGVTPRPDQFRYSRGKKHFVLNENSDAKLPQPGDEDTLGMGEPGIMQQINLEYMPDLREELTFLVARYPDEYTPIDGLIEKLSARRSLNGKDLEELRELLEYYAARRPAGIVMEVRDASRARGSFWPHHHPDGVWFRTEKGAIGGDESGVFFLDAQGLEYFRSMHFRQRRLDRGSYELADAAGKKTVPSPIVVTDCWYEEGKPETSDHFRSGMLDEVVFSCYHFRDTVGKLILQLQTMAKLGVIIGQPVLIAEEDLPSSDPMDTIPSEVTGAGDTLVD